MSGRVLGIDLGTTNSVVAVADRTSVTVLADGEGNQLIPSVVSFPPGGEVVVGRAARSRRLLDAQNTIYSVKRLIGRPFDAPEVQRAQLRFPFALRKGPTGGVLVGARSDNYTLSEISAFVLRRVREVAEDALGEQCERAVITVPANFNELQRSATKAAGRVAGLEVCRILNEPTAAALAYGYGRGSKETVAVFDFGGGTFDVTVLALSGEVFEVLATAGDTYLGGDDIDAMIADQMAEAFALHHHYDAREDVQAYERLKAAAEWAKCELSRAEDVQLRIEELAYANDGTSLDLTFGLTRAAFNQMVRSLVGRTLEVCEEAMRVAGIRPTQLDNVILVGGSTRIPLVKELVREYFEREPLDDIDPDLVVARGAAIQGHALMTAADRQAVGRVEIKRVTTAELRRKSHPPVGEMEDEDTVVRTSRPPPQASRPAPAPASSSAPHPAPPQDIESSRVGWL